MYGESRSINISVLQIQQILVLIRGDRMPDGGPVCLGHKCRNKFADGCKWPNIHYPLQNTNMMYTWYTTNFYSDLPCHFFTQL